MFNKRHGIFSSQNRVQYIWLAVDSTGSQAGFTEADLYVEDEGSEDSVMASNIEAIYPANFYQGQTVNYYNLAYNWYTLFVSTPA